MARLGLLAVLAALALAAVVATPANASLKYCGHTFGGDNIDVRKVSCHTARRVVRNWANGYQSDGQVNREALGFQCYDRSNPVEGLTVACLRGRQKIVFFANLLGASSSALAAAGEGPTAATSGQKTYAKFCCGRQYRPGTFRFGMSSFVTDMTWSKWGKKLARGTGTYQYNNCVPDCADGTISPTPATVVLTGRVACAGHFLFHHMKLYYAGRKLRSSTFCKGPL